MTDSEKRTAAGRILMETLKTSHRRWHLSWGTQLCSRRWTLRLKTPQERTRDWVNPGCAGRDSDGFRWGSVPVVLLGIATAAAPGSLEGNTEGPGTASSEPLLPS